MSLMGLKMEYTALLRWSRHRREGVAMPGLALRRVGSVSSLRLTSPQRPRRIQYGQKSPLHVFRKRLNQRQQAEGTLLAPAMRRLLLCVANTYSQ